MKKYEKPRFEAFKVGLSSGAGCSTGSSPGDNKCGIGTMASGAKCQNGGLAGKKCNGGSAATGNCIDGSVPD